MFEGCDKPLKWLRKAESDLAMACARIKGASTENFCFHAQQAAEKAIKAVYVAHRFPFKFIHALDTLVDDLEERGVEIPDELQDREFLKQVTRYAVDSRYDLDEIPTRADVREAVELAVAAVRWARAEITRMEKIRRANNRARKNGGTGV